MIFVLYQIRKFAVISSISTQSCLFLHSIQCKDRQLWVEIAISWQEQVKLMRWWQCLHYSRPTSFMWLCEFTETTVCGWACCSTHMYFLLLLHSKYQFYSLWFELIFYYRTHNRPPCKAVQGAPPTQPLTGIKM